MTKPFLGIVALFTILCMLNLPIILTLWRHGFDDGTYSHAYLIPFISMYLFYQLSQTGKLEFRAVPSIFSVLSLVLSCYVLFVTSNAQISIGYWVALIAVFVTSITMLYRFNWSIVFPAVFLIFIIPFWGVLVPLLQNISVAVVTYMMSFSGVPTYVEGNFVTIPAGVFEIADGCSGLRYMIVSLAIGSLFIFLNIKDSKKAILFLSITIFGALLTNWIRITALILIGEYTNMESSLMEDHNTFGWYLYVPFMVLLFYWGNKFVKFDEQHDHAHQNTNNILNPSNGISIGILIILILSSTTLKALFITSSDNMGGQIPTSKNTPDIFNYSSVSTIVSPEGTSDNTYLIFSFNNKTLDAKPTYYENNFIPEGWNTFSEEYTKDWHIFNISNGTTQAMIMVKYEIDNQVTPSSRNFKIKRLKSALIGTSDTKLHWSFIKCIKSCDAFKSVAINLLEKTALD
ncbi:exosortase [Colwellia polaris]|uniref:exosortase n=1 Tax=Colwellia polaris TaxID=326537 RepID=UPI001301FF1F|nr:exosortase [Colwellia polaris]